MNRLFKITTLFLLLILFSKSGVFAQGCVAIRSTGGICAMSEHADTSASADKGYWLYNDNMRYYRSFRHFIGKQEQYQRFTLHNNVINHVYTQDNSFSRVFNDRWTLTVDLPLADNSRSQVSGTTRFSTHSFGVGDMSVTGLYWLFNPKTSKNGNIQAGLGIKFPTGADGYEDYFLNAATGARTLAPVDQSIQLGDGGTGIIVDINSYYNISHSFGFYGNFFYLVNPRDVNGVASSSSAPTATKIAITSDVLSVPDQYMVRAGADLAVNKFNFSLGVRDDCVPVRDLIGGSDGFRRPGWVFSMEPGINWAFKNVALYAFVPIAII